MIVNRISGGLAIAMVGLSLTACGGSSHPAGLVIRSPPAHETAGSSISSTSESAAAVAAWKGGCPPASVFSESTGVAAAKIQGINNSGQGQGETICLWAGFPAKSKQVAATGLGVSLQFFYGTSADIVKELGGKGSVQSACTQRLAIGKGTQYCAAAQVGDISYLVLATNVDFPPKPVLDAILKTRG